MNDPFRPRPPEFPRERLHRAGLGDHLDQLAATFEGYGYRDRVEFARFVNAHADEAIRERVLGADATSGTTQPTGGTVADPQQQQQVDAAAAAAAPVPAVTPAGETAPPAPTGDTAPAEPAPEQAPAQPAPEQALPAEQPAPPAPAPEPQAPAPEQPTPAPDQPAQPAPAAAPEAQPAAPDAAPAEAQPAPAPDAAPQQPEQQPAAPDAPAPTVTVGDTAVPADPAALNDLTVDQLRQAAQSVGVPTTGRKADLVERVATAAATGEQPAITPEQVQADAAQPAQPPTDATSAPQAPAEAPAPADAPEPATGDTGAQQAPAETGGGTTDGGGTP